MGRLMLNLDPSNGTGPDSPVADDRGFFRVAISCIQLVVRLSMDTNGIDKRE